MLQAVHIRGLDEGSLNDVAKLFWLTEWVDLSTSVSSLALGKYTLFKYTNLVFKYTNLVFLQSNIDLAGGVWQEHLVFEILKSFKILTKHKYLCVKGLQIRSFCGPDAENTDQKKLRNWTLFKQEYA